MSRPVVDCPDCYGEGWLECPDCGGSGGGEGPYRCSSCAFPNASRTTCRGCLGACTRVVVKLCRWRGPTCEQRSEPEDWPPGYLIRETPCGPCTKDMSHVY